MTPVERLLEKLPGAKISGNGFSAKCPAHEDRNASLSVSEGRDGRVLVHCHAGCAPEAICQAIGLTLADLMPASDNSMLAPNGNQGGKSKSRGRAFETMSAALHELESKKGQHAMLWIYRDANGQPVGAVVRWDDTTGKDIRPLSRHADGWRIEAMPSPRPLYNLPELAGVPCVLVVEGEKCAEAARSLGFTATTSAGGSQTAGKTDWSSLAGKEVWLLRDNDKPGQKYADEVAGQLAALDPKGVVKELDPRAVFGRADLPGGFDIADAIAECATDEDRAALRERLEKAAFASAALLPSGPATPSGAPVSILEDWPEPLAEEAYYGLAGRFVRVVEPHSEADPVALLVQFLVAVGNVIGRTAHALADGAKHYTNEYAVLVGQSSKARKGTSWARVKELLTQLDEAWASSRVLGGLSSGEGLIWNVRDPVESRERVKERGAPARYETVVSDEGEPDKRILIQEAEFANVLRQNDRTGNTLSAIIRQAWDAGNLRTLTKSSPARATEAHVSQIGHITREELHRYLTATESANGFGNRYMWFLVRRSKLLPLGGSPDSESLREIARELKAVIEFGRSAGEMRFDDAAREMWCEVYSILSRDGYGLAGALTGRAEAHVLRLSLIYAVLDCSPAIRVEHLAAALAVWTYAGQSVRSIFGSSTGNPLADELLQLLCAAGAKGLTRNELRDMVGKSMPADRITQALGVLLRVGLAQSEQRNTGGRPAEVWFALSEGTRHAA